MPTDKQSESPVEPQAEDIKTQAEWEKELECFFNDYDPDRKVAFKDITPDMVVYVDHAARTQWLEKNGFELTRENYVNLNLVPEKKSS